MARVHLYELPHVQLLPGQSPMRTMWRVRDWVWGWDGETLYLLGSGYNVPLAGIVEESMAVQFSVGFVAGRIVAVASIEPI